MPHKTSRKTKQEPKSRKLKQPEYRSFRLHKRIKHAGNKLPSAWSLLKASSQHILQHKKLFLGLCAVYVVLILVLVQGFTFTSDLSAAKESVQEVFSGTTGQLAASLTVFSMLVGSTSANTEAASVYQSLIIIIMSLAMIWALRQTHAGQKVTVKDAMYKSTYPLVQFVLVLIIIGVQMIPFIAGNFVYSATVGGGIAVSALEIILWSLLAFLLVVWSIYMVSASVFALYIVSLPDMKPISSVKSARKLVQFRRWTIIRKVLFLPLVIVVVGFLIMLPVIMFLTPAAEVVFLLLSSVMVVFSHSYMYSLYRELL